MIEKSFDGEVVARAAAPGLAIVVIGGALAVAVLTRIIQPPMLVAVHRIVERVRRRGVSVARDEAA